MFGKKKAWSYGKLIGFVGGTIAGGVAVATAMPVLKKRALRATTILKKDHRTVSGLFWALRQTTDASIRRSIFHQIQNQLEMHTQAEEEIFYPAVRNVYSAIAERQVDEAKDEHRQIRDLMHAVSLIDPNSFAFMSKVNELKERIEHHVEEEENEMFPLAQSHMSSEELDHLGRRIHERKVQLREQMAA